MTRARTWLTIVLPFAFACGVSHAQPAPPAPPAPPPPHVVPPVPPHGIDTAALRQNVDKQIGEAIETIRKNPQIPAALRDKLIARMDKVKASIDKRVAHLDLSDLDKMGEQLGEMGEEISGALDGIDLDVDGLGSDVARYVVREVTHSLEHGPDRDIKRAVHDAMRGAHVHVHHGHDDDDDDDAMVGASIDDDDDHDADEATISNAGKLALKQAQRDEIKKIRDATKTTVNNSRKRIDDLSNKLHDALAKDGTNDGEIARDIDAISAEEATIRKAKILAWVASRRILDSEQRKKVEAAAKPK